MLGGFTLFDRNISLNFAMSAFVWFVGAGLVITDLFLPTDELGHLGIVVCCGGAVLMIRFMMCRSVRQLENLFEVGRDVGRSEMSQVPRQPQRIH